MFCGISDALTKACGTLTPLKRKDGSRRAVLSRLHFPWRCPLSPRKTVAFLVFPNPSPRYRKEVQRPYEPTGDTLDTWWRSARGRMPDATTSWLPTGAHAAFKAALWIPSIPLSPPHWMRKRTESMFCPEAIFQLHSHPPPLFRHSKIKWLFEMHCMPCNITFFSRFFDPGFFRKFGAGQNMRTPHKEFLRHNLFGHEFYGVRHYDQSSSGPDD